MRFATAAAVLSLTALGEAELLHARFHHHGNSTNSTLLHGLNGTISHGLNHTLSHGLNSTLLHGLLNSTLHHNTTLHHNSTQNHTSCMTFTNLSPQDWVDADTDSWLADWWQKNVDAIHQNGFAVTFGELVLGQQNWSCLVGEPCEVPCIPQTASMAHQNGTLRVRQSSSSTSSQQAGNVANSLSNMQGAFGSLSTAFTQAAAAIGNGGEDAMVANFWSGSQTDLNNQSGSTGSGNTAQILHAIGAIIGLGAAMATGGAAIPAAVISTLYSNGVTLGLGSMSTPTSEPDFIKTSDLGYEMTKFVQAGQDTFDNLNSQYMNGTGTQNVLTGGSFMSTTNTSALMNTMTTVLNSAMINYLWRQQPVFILGGGDCAEDQGIGTGGNKNDNSIIWWCDGNTAWYLYAYNWDGKKSGTGYLTRPWGSDRLGGNSYYEQQGGANWPDINPSDAVQSSVKSYMVGGYNYTQEIWQQRLGEILSTGNNPWFEGDAMEGLWTIPVCDMSAVASGAASGELDWPDMTSILQPYGTGSIPKWCGPICKNDESATQEFFAAANLLYGSQNDFVVNCE